MEKNITMSIAKLIERNLKAQGATVIMTRSDDKFVSLEDRVVISNNKIAAAACILPLADDKDIAKELGTRHRAGLGISKESDAIAIIISEETGKISVAKDGTLIADVKGDGLKNILIKHVVTKRFGDERQQRIEKVKIRKQKNNKEEQTEQSNENQNKQQE